MRFLPVSAMKMSPFGAVRSKRGPDRPSANNRTAKCGGTDNPASAGFSTTFGGFPAEAVLKGAGKDASVKACSTPGAAWRQSPASETEETDAGARSVDGEEPAGAIKVDK